MKLLDYNIIGIKFDIAIIHTKRFSNIHYLFVKMYYIVSTKFKSYLTIRNNIEYHKYSGTSLRE